MKSDNLLRGAIHNEEAYIRGKMLDHSSWQKGEKIVRLITPSDIDACWDNNGKTILAEFSSTETEWSKLERGQRWLYESCIKNTPHVAVLCKHCVGLHEERQINSKTDVTHFQVMLHDHEFLRTRVLDGKHWPKFVDQWMQDSMKLRRRLLTYDLSRHKGEGG